MSRAEGPYRNDIEVHQAADLTSDLASAVLALAERCVAHDGRPAINEQARLLLRGSVWDPQSEGLQNPHLDSSEPMHWLVWASGQLVGYAQWQPGPSTGQLFVDPGWRRRGVGSALLGALPTPRVWAFQVDAAASGFAASAGLVTVRELLVLGRGLPAELGGSLPPGVHVTAFSPDAEAPFLDVNAAAFAGHPEQGRFSASDFAARRAEDWWDPAGLLLARRDGRLVGFHWTKVHPGGRGEVYVIGVHPDAAGISLGRGLLQEGLNHLASEGCREVFLYVDGRNEPAVALYRRSGFEPAVRDVLFSVSES